MKRNALQSDRQQHLSEALALYLQGGTTGERGARRLFELLWPRFVANYQRWGQSHAVAEEIASEAMLKILRNAKSLHDPVAMEKWAYTIAHNTFLTWIRDTKLENAHESLHDDSEWEFIHSSVADPSQCDSDTLLCLQQQMERFCHEHSERASILEQSVMSCMSIEDLSRLLGRTLSASKEYLSQCRKRLWQYLSVCID